MDLGGASLDLETGALRNGDHCVRLTGREQAILLHLHRLAGHPVHVERLLGPLYSHRADGIGSPRAVYVFVCALRAKLAKVQSAATIVTYWGRGYMLAPDGVQKPIGKG